MPTAGSLGAPAVDCGSLVFVASSVQAVLKSEPLRVKLGLSPLNAVLADVCIYIYTHDIYIYISCTLSRA